MHMDLNSGLPANGTYEWNGTAVVTTNAWSGMARILPQMEQETLFQKIDLNAHYNVQPAISSLRVGTFMCPSEVNDRGHGTDPIFGNKYWPLNYVMNEGSWAVMTSKASGLKGGDGAFGPNCRFTSAHFTDGMSNTLALAEVKAFTNRIGGAANTATFFPPLAIPSSITSLPLGVFSPTSFTHVEWVDGKIHETGFTTVFTPNTKVIYNSGGMDYDVDVVLATESNVGDTYAAVTSRSYHTGGVNVLMMDGSVHFKSDNIQQNVWRALGTRSGGEVTPTMK
jgi:prepilin-type processing-associated H-X9-DG protein